VVAVGICRLWLLALSVGGGSRVLLGLVLVSVRVSHVHGQDGSSGEGRGAVVALVALPLTDGVRGHVTLQIAVLVET
jgi:hypothetical protein